MTPDNYEETGIVDHTDDPTDSPVETPPRTALDVALWVAVAVAIIGVIVVGALTLRSLNDDDSPSQTTAEMLLERGLRAVQSDPASGTAHIDLGSAYFEVGDYERAATEFEIAQQSPETEIFASYNLGHVYRLTEEHERAIEAFNEVMAMSPPEGVKIPGVLFRDARYWAAVEYLATDQPQQAIDVASPLLETVPLDAEAANVVAAAYAKLGETEAAKELYERVLAVQPGDATAQEGLDALK